MARWLQSGFRRDLCVLVAGAKGGELRAQELKTRLERRYDDHVDPGQFYGALEGLERTGIVESRTEGLADVYSLTEAGERRLREQFEWMDDQLSEEGRGPP